MRKKITITAAELRTVSSCISTACKPAAMRATLSAQQVYDRSFATPTTKGT